MWSVVSSTPDEVSSTSTASDAAFEQSEDECRRGDPDP